MKIVGSAVVGAGRDRVWSALRDPSVLVSTIPGCRRLESTGADTYRMTVSAGVASIKGVYQGEVALSDPERPERFTLRARGAGAPGTVDATVRIRLSEVDGGATRIDYDAEAVVGGMIGGVGQRMLGSVAKKTAGEFFTAVERHLRVGPAPEPESAAPASGDGALASGDGALARVLSADQAFPEGQVSPAGHMSPAGLMSPDGQGSLAVLESPAEQVFPATQVSPAGQMSSVGQVYERPRAERAGGTPVWPVLTAFGMGAGVALGSAVIGWLLGHTGRRR